MNKCIENTFLFFHIQISDGIVLVLQKHVLHHHYILFIRHPFEDKRSLRDTISVIFPYRSNPLHNSDRNVTLDDSNSKVIPCQTYIKNLMIAGYFAQIYFHLRNYFHRISSSHSTASLPSNRSTPHNHPR